MWPFIPVHSVWYYMYICFFSSHLYKQESSLLLLMIFMGVGEKVKIEEEEVNDDVCVQNISVRKMAVSWIRYVCS